MPTDASSMDFDLSKYLDLSKTITTSKASDYSEAQALEDKNARLLDSFGDLSAVKVLEQQRIDAEKTKAAAAARSSAGIDTLNSDLAAAEALRQRTSALAQKYSDLSNSSSILDRLKAEYGVKDQLHDTNTALTVVTSGLNNKLNTITAAGKTAADSVESNSAVLASASADMAKLTSQLQANQARMDGLKYHIDAQTAVMQASAQDLEFGFRSKTLFISEKQARQQADDSAFNRYIATEHLALSKDQAKRANTQLDLSIAAGQRAERAAERAELDEARKDTLFNAKLNYLDLQAQGKAAGVSMDSAGMAIYNQGLAAMGLPSVDIGTYKAEAKRGSEEFYRLFDAGSRVAKKQLQYFDNPSAAAALVKKIPEVNWGGSASQTLDALKATVVDVESKLKLDPKYKASSPKDKDAMTTERINQAFSDLVHTHGDDLTSPNSLLYPGGVEDYSTSPKIASLPLYQKVYKPLIDNKASVTPSMLLPLATTAFNSGQITSAELAGLPVIAREMLAGKMAKGGLMAIGGTDLESIKFKVPERPGALFGSKINLFDMQEIYRSVASTTSRNEHNPVNRTMR